MKIFTDQHHFDLFYSFQLLFEKRLECQIFRGIGLDWKTEGYWNIGQQEDLATCLLSNTNGQCAEILSKYDVLPIDWAVFSLHLPRIGQIIDCGNGIYQVEDKSKQIANLAITLEAFKNTKFDLLISTTPQHFYTYEKLRNQFQPQAKHIHQIAGIGCPLPPEAKNVMFNTIPKESLEGINYVIYKQEFDLKVFEHSLPQENSSKIARAYCHFPSIEKLWNELNLGWDFKFVGKTLGPIKDIIVDSKELAREITNSGFSINIKPGGESYGHCLHNSYAIGRPTIINGDDFRGTQGAELLTPENHIDVDKYSVDELRKVLMKASEPENHIKMCDAAYKRFKEVVNFDEDTEKVKKFLERLQ